MRKLSLLLVLALGFISSAAFAGGAPAAGKKFDWKTSHIVEVANAFVKEITAGNYEAAYKLGGTILREKRTLEEFTADMKRWKFDRAGTVEWDNGNNALPVNNGFKLMGTYTPTEGNAFRVYMHLEGDAHVASKDRDRKWSEKTKWTVMDYRSAESMFDRLANGAGFTPLTYDENAFNWRTT